MDIKRLVIGEIDNNCYILKSANACAVIDPSDDYERILQEAGRVDLVLLTHGHFDHIGAVRALQRTGARVYMHGDDIDKIASGRFWVEPFQPDELITDGTELRLGELTIKVIHTPGHTGGGVCFYVGRALFSGDTLFKNNIGRTDLPSGNYHQLVSSIKNKLLTLPPETVVYPGHGASTTIENEKSNRYLVV